MMKKKLICFGFALLLVGCQFSGFPDVGTKAPLSDNKVLQPGVNGREVCSMEPFMDEPLHRITIRQAVEKHMPLVVMFGTPQHCTQCVDQIQRLTALSEKYDGKVAFIHVDAYRDTRTVKEWVVKGEPWTGLIDREGVIRHVFHGPTPFQEIEPKIQELMSS